MEAYKVFQNDITPFSYLQCSDKALTEGEKLNHCLLSTTGSINAALIGDSHADDKFHGFAQNSEDLNWMLIGNSSCPPLLGVDVVGIEHTCRQKFEKIVGWLATQDAVKTVAISFWANYGLTEPYAADHVRMKLNADSIQISSDEVHMHDRIALFDYGLNQTVRKLIQANKRVIILVDIPELPYFPVDCVKGRPNCIDSFSNVLARQAKHRESLKKLKIDFPSVLIFDPLPLFCSESTCSYKNGDTVLYRDSHHLTIKGSEMYGDLFSKWDKFYSYAR